MGDTQGLFKDKDAFKRMNFLYQASHCLLAQDPENQELVRFYMHTMKTIGQRLVLKLAPSIKRNICKTCSSLLVPGVTSTVRHRQRRRHMVVTCLFCRNQKRFLSNDDYKLWCERPEADVQQSDRRGPEQSQSREKGQETLAAQESTRALSSCGGSNLMCASSSQSM
uniref:ribonuclease P protein subunit p21 n=1 Tax=Myxine glutinosa TaxID=7769 RepID=UPI00358F21D7